MDIPITPSERSWIVVARGGGQHHPRSGGRGSCVLVVVAGCCFLMHFVVNQVGSFWEEQVIQSLPLIVLN